MVFEVITLFRLMSFHLTLFYLTTFHPIIFYVAFFLPNWVLNLISHAGKVEIKCYKVDKYLIIHRTTLCAIISTYYVNCEVNTIFSLPVTSCLIKFFLSHDRPHFLCALILHRSFPYLPMYDKYYYRSPDLSRVLLSIARSLTSVMIDRSISDNCYCWLFDVWQVLIIIDRQYWEVFLSIFSRCGMFGKSLSVVWPR